MSARLTISSFLPLLHQTAASCLTNPLYTWLSILAIPALSQELKEASNSPGSFNMKMLSCEHKCFVCLVQDKRCLARTRKEGTRECVFQLEEEFTDLSLFYWAINVLLAIPFTRILSTQPIEITPLQVITSQIHFCTITLPCDPPFQDW